jgi:hypothetical protein
MKIIFQIHIKFDSPLAVEFSTRRLFTEQSMYLLAYLSLFITLISSRQKSLERPANLTIIITDFYL